MINKISINNYNLLRKAIIMIKIVSNSNNNNNK
jgi:hypothetical protein